MSRSQFHHAQENFGQALASIHMTISGTATLAVPSSGTHLRVFKAVLKAPAAMLLKQTVQLRDAASVRHTFVVPLNGTDELDLGTRHLAFANSVTFTGATENVYVTIFYDQKKNP